MAESLADLKGYVGRSVTTTDVVTAAGIAQLAATFGIEPPARDKGDLLPEGWHIPYFVPTHGPQNMREDGQPAGGLVPSIPLPIQRLRGESAQFLGPLRIGDDMTRTAEIAEIEVDGDVAGGPVVSLKFRQTLTGPAGVAVIEERHFLYYGAGYALDANAPPVPKTAELERVIEPDPVTMFRFSAIRFNSHRIHYDRDYTVKREGHPGLIVQGTMINHLLLEMARELNPGTSVARFDFRIHKPIYDTGPFTLRAARDARKGRGAALWALDTDGVMSMTADALYADA